jgi:tetratricopeptide (TPR) repeat protein
LPDRYWGTFWIHAATRNIAEQEYSAIGKEAGRGDTFQAGKFWLSEQDKPWLLIIDNADDKGLRIKELIPHNAAGHVLISTRRRKMVDEIGPQVEVELRNMVPREAVKLLLTRAGISESARREDYDSAKTDASLVAHSLGYLALALCIAGSAIKQSQLTIRQWFERYRSTRKAWLHDIGLSEDEKNVISGWRLTLKKLQAGEEQDAADALSVLGIIACLHHDSIPGEIFVRAWLSPQNRGLIAEGLLNHGLHDFDAARQRLESALHLLHDYSILDFDRRNLSCSVHPIIHDWTREQLCKDKLLSMFYRHALHILAYSISPHLEASSRESRRKLIPHIAEVLEVSKFPGHKGAAVSYEEARLSHGTLAGQYKDRFAAVYAESGMWRRATSLQTEVVKWRKAKLGHTHSKTLSAERTLSQMLWNHFKLKETIEIQSSLVGKRLFSRPQWSEYLYLRPRNLDYYVACDDLSQSVWLAGEWGLAKHLSTLALNSMANILGNDDPMTINALFNLGRANYHLGEIEEARTRLLEVYYRRSDLFGSRHPDTLMSSNELGLIYLAEGNYDQAEDLIRSTYEQRKVVLGEEHAYTLWSANDLAKVYYSRKSDSMGPTYPKASKAVELLLSIIPAVTRTLTDVHVGMQMTKGNLARAYVRCQRLSDAEDTLKDLIATISSTEDNPNLVEIKCGYADVLIRMGKLVEAQRVCNEVLTYLRSLSTISALPLQIRLLLPKNLTRASDRHEQAAISMLEQINHTMAEQQVRETAAEQGVACWD